MISLLSIQDVRGHGLPGTPVSRVRERLRRRALAADVRTDTALGRDLDRLASRLARLRARGGAFAQIELSPELQQVIDHRSQSAGRGRVVKRKRA